MVSNEREREGTRANKREQEDTEDMNLKRTRNLPTYYKNRARLETRSGTRSGTRPKVSITGSANAEMLACSQHLSGGQN